MGSHCFTGFRSVRVSGLPSSMFVYVLPVKLHELAWLRMIELTLKKQGGCRTGATSVNSSPLCLLLHTLDLTWLEGSLGWEAVLFWHVLVLFQGPEVKLELLSSLGWGVEPGCCDSVPKRKLRAYDHTPTRGGAERACWSHHVCLYMLNTDVLCTYGGLVPLGPFKGRNCVFYCLCNIPQ
jgi:hypothetical protein